MFHFQLIAQRHNATIKRSRKRAAVARAPCFNVVLLLLLLLCSCLWKVFGYCTWHQRSHMYRGIVRVQHPACEALHPQVLCPKEVRAVLVLVHVLAWRVGHWLV